jgi:hypothetical protein
MQGVRLHNQCNIDCEPIHVYVNGNETTTLGPDAWYEVPLQSAPLDLTLYAVEYSMPATDYVGMLNVSVAAF